MLNLRTLTAFLLASLSSFAGIAGKWDVTSLGADGGTIKSTLVVAESAGKVDAKLSIGERSLPLSDVAFADDQLSFRLMWDSTGVFVKVKLAGDRLEGKWTADSGETGSLTAVRSAAPAPAADSPAGIAGKWKLTAERPNREPVKVDLELKEETGKWTGTLITPDGMSLPAASVTFDGKELVVKLETDNGSYTLKLSPDGPNMKGTGTGPDGSQLPLTATR